MKVYAGAVIVGQLLSILAVRLVFGEDITPINLVIGTAAGLYLSYLTGAGE